MSPDISMTRTSKIRRIEQELRVGSEAEARGELAGALASFQRALRLCDGGKLDRQKVEVLRRIGHIHATRNAWDLARQAYEESLRLSTEQGNLTGEADAQNSLGIMYFEMGKLKKSLECYEQALEIAEHTHDADLTATICNNQGAVANVRGEWQKALALYEECVARFESIGNSTALSNTYLNMAMTHADNGNWSGAHDYYLKCNELARSVGDPLLLAKIKLNRVELYLAIGDLQLGEALCLQALDAFSAMEDHLGEADSNTTLGNIHGQRKEWEKAFSCFKTSIRLSREHGSPLSEAEARMHFGRVLRRKGNKEEARKQLSEALELFRALKSRKEVLEIRQELDEISTRN